MLYKNSDPFINPLIVALDVDTEKEAYHFTKTIGDIVGGFKVGPRLVLRHGVDLIKNISQVAPVFFDFKFFDIPNTMEASVRAAFEMGATMVSVHALAGSEALIKMAQLEEELKKERPFKICSISLLTSWNQEQIPKVFNEGTLEEHVEKLVSLVQESGLKSVVCSPLELKKLKARGLFLVTPGIRLSKDNFYDQKRVSEPKVAVRNGANVIVVGRPILEAQDPRSAAMEFLTQIYE